jgi:pimeloyl-ACP methyl ester carboxylesterase
MGEHARVVADVFEMLDVRDATLVGHSMGGTISILALDDIAGRVARVVLAEAVLSWDESIWTDQVARTPFDEWVTTFDSIQRRPEVWARGGMLRRRRDAIERIAPAILETSAGAMHASARALQREASDPALYERFLGITRPLEYVFGDLHDNTPFCARVCSDGVRVRFVRRAGHLMMLDNPDDFYAIVADAGGS